MSTTSTTSHHGPGPDSFDDLAWAIERDGIEQHEAAATTAAAWARAQGHDPLLLDVLADPAQPAAARERAFGHVARAVARPVRSDPRRIAA